MTVSETTTPEQETEERNLSIRIPIDLDARVGEVSKIVGLRKPDLYRLAIRQGVESVLEILKRPAVEAVVSGEVAP